MATVSLYTFQDASGQEQTFSTFLLSEARETARKNNWLCFDNEYEYSDRTVVWDYTGNQVLRAACEEGYIVQVWKGTGGGEPELVEEYRAGNSPRCSQTYVPVEAGVGYQQMAAFASRTAQELGEKHGILFVMQGEDPDLLEKLKAELDA